MAWKETGVNAYVRRHITPKLLSAYTREKVLLYVIAGMAVQGLDKLGDPRTGVTLGGARLGKAERAKLNGSFNHQFRYQTGQTDAAAAGSATSTPTASVFADDLVGQAETRWKHFWCPIKVRQSRIDAAKTGLAIASIVEEAVGMGFQRRLEAEQAALWNDTLNSAGQDNEEWATHIGLRQWNSSGVDHSGDGGPDESANVVVGRVTRATETEMRAKVNWAEALVAGGYIEDTRPRLSLFRSAQIVDAIGGVSNRSAGAGSLVICRSDLWDLLANEAEDKKYQIHVGGIPNHAIGGFKRKIIQYGDILIAHDPDCPEGEIHQLTPESFLYEIQAGSNFRIEPWQKKWLSEEGGGYYQWTQIHAKTRFTCREPWLQIKYTGMTTNGN